MALYLALTYHCREAHCRVEIRKLGDFLGMCETTTKQHLKALVNAKIVGKKLKFALRNGKRVCLANEYTLLDVPSEGKSRATPSA